jgi:sedoheptulose-bisphosphatase
VCKYACSEEVPEPVDVGGEGFCVAFDPLDGSSIVDTNFAVGTIFGVWPGEKLKDITGREQVRFLRLAVLDAVCYLLFGTWDIDA